MRWKLRALVLNVFLKIHLVNGDDLHFLRNDVMTLAGWGQAATFQTINYQPVCGVLQSGFTNRIDQGTCKTAMSYYKQSSKTYATYNDLGVETKNVPGDGETFCLCFSLKDTAGKMGDFCIAISADGQQVIWWTLSYDSRASGQFMPASNKALPACPEVDLAALSSSLLTGRASTTKETPSSTQTTSSSNTPTQSTTKPSVESDTTLQASLSTIATQTSSSRISSAESTDTTGTSVSSSSSITTGLPPLSPSASNPQPSSNSQGLLTGDKIALGVGLGVGIPGLVLAYLTWRANQ